jgi:predicted N-acyltransferase
MNKPQECVTEVVGRIADVAPAAWDACANPEQVPFNPFLSHAFLRCLEDAGSVGGRSGWTPRHLVLKDEHGEIAGCAPCYIKTHSKGEYVFDHAWADAYLRAGGDYYPKLQIAVPFTPVPGRRLLTRPGPAREANEAMLAAAAAEVVKRGGLSGVHITFLTQEEWARPGARGYLQRTGQQFHWSNQGYATFEDFLGSLASRKRKAVRKEREQARAGGLDIEWVTGRDITQAHWDAFFAFYMETGSRKWGRPYLNRAFFSLLGEAMSERCLLVMVRNGSRYVAGALNMIGGDCLYGRYWGAIEHHPCLHFEVCYYQAIDYAIQHGLQVVEAGAQGEHKLARGYEPTITRSIHYIDNPGFRRAIADYLMRERAAVAREQQALDQYTPFRKGEVPD